MQITSYTFIIFLLGSLLAQLSITAQAAHTIKYTIMLDPAGDARTPGRIIGDSFERAITFQLALELKKAIEQDNEYSVLITRSPGETVLPLQNANFANRVNPDLYITLHCYDSPDEKFSISLYTMSRAEPFITPPPTLSLVPIHKAHWTHFSDVKKISLTMHETLSGAYGHQFLIHSVLALALVPLTGIQSPAISIELNCHTSNDSSQYIQPLVHAIKAALSS